MLEEETVFTNLKNQIIKFRQCCICGKKKPNIDNEKINIGKY